MEPCDKKKHIVFHKIIPASQKETSPLDRFAINSLPHKSSAFVPQCEKNGTKMWSNVVEPASQKETSPLDRFAINSLPHKSSAFVPQCEKNGTKMWYPKCGTINAKMMWSYMMNQVYETLLFLLPYET